MLVRGQNLVGYRHYSDDIVDRFIKKSVDKIFPGKNYHNVKSYKKNNQQ